MVPVTVDGETVKLAVITHKPAGNGPFPTLVFHHGSTGRGTDTSLFARPYDPKQLSDWFVARGWAVILPSRRGRGGSEGRYDEGFAIDRSQGYSCEPTLSLPGADRALRDIDAITPLLLAQPFVDRSRFAVGGQSRGGILTVAWAGRHPGEPKAAINFVGGWMSTSCPSATAINGPLFARGTAYPLPMQWLYGENDSYYPVSATRASFQAFQAAGGKGSYDIFTPPAGMNGHFINTVPSLWTATLEAYLAARGLPAKPL
ncbi:MAG TPA: CocE/NonD family hydrolase [Reyranella sp.]|nr:CocE/NonD family hydrolase [Reyranella sp.]